VTRDEKRLNNFWSNLAIFWRKDQIDQWREALEEENAARTNLLILSPDSHVRWGKQHFALKPLESKPNALRVRFHWLNTEKENLGTISYKWHSSRHGASFACDRAVDGKAKMIETGDVLRLESTDLEKEIPPVHSRRLI
jgi:hypothetical protein